MRRTVALITAIVLTLPMFLTASFAKTEEVLPYCERIVESVLAVNLGGEDVTVEGAPFTGEKNEKNIKTFIKEPVELKAPSGTINAFTRIELKILHLIMALKWKRQEMLTERKIFAT